jgi:hypothetical protein
MVKIFMQGILSTGNALRFQVIAKLIYTKEAVYRVLQLLTQTATVSTSYFIRGTDIVGAFFIRLLS